jgi:glycosyltransferase involved in cell wall biosynthesis
MRIVICEGSPAVPNRALDEVTRQADFFLWIVLASPYLDDSKTWVVARRRGQEISRREVPTPHIPATGVLHVLLLPWLHLRYSRAIWDALGQWPEVRDACFICRTWIFCLTGLLARWRGRVRRLVYWVGDYYPFGRRISAATFSTLIFRVAERVVLRHADEVWYVCQRLRDVHTSRRGKRLTKVPERAISSLFTSHADVHGLWSAEHLHRLVYVGYVNRKQGLDVILPAIQNVSRLHPDVRLDVIGTGNDLEEVKATARELGIADRVVFHGFVENEDDLCGLVARAAAGFALYDPSLVHAQYTVNSKVYLYIGCGTPVVISRTTGSFDYVMGGSAGVEAGYSSASVVAAIEAITADVATNLRYRSAARRLADHFADEALELKRAIENCSRPG